MRQYLVGSWNNADSYDYSGEMVGNRKAKSHMINGKANLASYGDAVEPKKASTRSIKEKIVPQEYTLNKLDVQEAELRKAYKAGEVSPHEFGQLMHALTQKRNRAAKSRVKALGESLDIEEEIVQEMHNTVQVAHIKPMPTKVYFALVVLVSIAMLILSN